MSELKTIIDANIKENGNQEITGKTLNYVLNKIAEGTQKDWNESDATNGEYIKGRTHGVTYEHVSVEGTLKELGYIPGEYVSVLHYARDNGVLEGKGLYLGGLLYNPIVGEEYRAKYEGPSVYAKVVEVEDGYDVQIKGASDTGNLLKVAIVEYKKIDDAYISMDIARKSQVDALEQKLNNLPQGEEFDKQGNYPLLHVGTADDLAGRGESVPASFGFRASGGKSIKDGRAYIKRIKGNSVVWNQRLQWRGTGNVYKGLTVTYEGGKVHIQGAPEDTEIVFYSLFWDEAGGMRKFTKNHYYLIRGASEHFELNVYSNVSVVGGNCITQKIGDTMRLNLRGYDLTIGQEINESFSAQVIDLTQMFGSGNEPTTIEEYNSRKPIVEDEYAYNEGEVIHCNTESIKSVGDNAWDEEVELGSISSTDGENIPNDNAIRPKNYIKILPNEQYHINVPFNEHLIFYDERKQFLSTLWQSSVKTFTTPSNAAYMRFRFNSVYGTTYKNDIMITLVHSGWKQDTDAGYQPYWQDILPLPIIRKYFPDGMKKAGSAHDEIRYNKASGKWEAVQRIGSVDMSQFRWYQGAGFWASYNSYEFMSDMKKPTGNGEVANICCKKYVAGSWTSVYEGAEGNIAMYSVDGRIGIVDSSIQTEADVRAAMQGVILYYELAEPIVTEITDTFRDYYQVADFGTEMSQSSVPSAAFSADIIYQFNAVDMIREHELEITELQKVIATMQAQLASLTNS